MIRYLVKLLILCVVGAAVVWFGLPPFKKAAPRPYAKLASLLLGRPVAVEGTGEIADAGRAGELVSGALAKAGEAGGEALAKVPGGSLDFGFLKDRAKKNATNDTASATAVAAAAAVAAGEDLPEGARKEVQEDGSVVVYVEEELPPDPRGALNDDPGYPMAVVVTNSFYFDARGNKLGSMPGGTVLETLETTQAAGKMVCKSVVFHPVRRLWQDQEIWFEATDLLLLNAPYQDLPRAERDAIVDYCTAKGKWMDAYGKLAEKAIAKYAADHKNPYEEEYQAAKVKHDELLARLADNKKKLQWSQTHDDPNRGKYLAEGRTLAAEQREEAKVWQPIVKKWQQWESAHMTPTDTFTPGGDDAGGFGRTKPTARPRVAIPGKDDVVTVEETATMKALREQMEALAPVVHAIVPDL